MVVKVASDVSINEEQGLYVIPCGGGYSCLGFDVCLEWSRQYARWLRARGIRASAPAKSKRGTMEAYRRYRKLADRIAARYRATGEQCDAQLTPQLVGMEGRRVEVVDKYGERRRFKVGKSTGWIPIHLELANSRSRGGGAVTGAPFRSVRVVG